MQTPIPAIMLPYVDSRTEQFGAAVLHVIENVNTNILGRKYFTVQREAVNRWSIMGSERAEWLEFEYLGPRTFQLTRHLHSPCCMKTDFRSRVPMEDDVLNSFRMLFVIRNKSK